MFRVLIAALAFAAAPAVTLADDLPGDVKAGEKVFKKCKACHMVGADAENKAGPALNGVVGRAMGAVDGFKYSKALTELGAGGKTWTPEELDAFLTKPRDYAKGIKMTFAGLRKDDDRVNVIAYLASFPEDGS